MNLCPVLVGRSEELKALTTALRGGGAVLVSGEAGIGKSRLLREFAEEAEQGGHTVVWGRPEVVADPGPYSLLTDLLENLSFMLSEAEDAERLLEALSNPDRTKPETPARQIAARTRGLLGQLGKRPVVLIEDIHLADEPSQAVVAHLARVARDDGTLLACSYRSEETMTPGMTKFLDVLTKERMAEQVQLSPLDEDQLGEMLEAMHGAPASPKEVERILTMTEGIPFFVEEVGPDSGESIPEAITQAALNRLARVGESARRVITVASLAPGAVDPVVLADAAGIPVVDIPPLLVEGVRVGLLADRDGRIVFRHGLLREAIAAALVSVERASLHRAVAEAIERNRPSELDRHAAVLAIHYEGAGDEQRAAEYFCAAGERALAMGVPDDANGFFVTAISLFGQSPHRVRAVLGQAEVLRRQRDIQSAVAIVESAVRALNADDAPAELIDALLYLGERLVEIEDGSARDVLQQVADLASKQTVTGDTRARIALALAGAARLDADDIRDLVGPLKEALAIAESTGSQEYVLKGCSALGGVLAASGEKEEAERFFERAMGIARTHGFDDAFGRAYGVRATAHAYAGQLTKALALLDEAREHLTRGLSSHLALQVDETRSWILWWMGSPEAADRLSARVAMAGPIGRYPRVVRVWARLERADAPGAWSELEAWWTEIGEEYRSCTPEELLAAPSTPASTGASYAILAEGILSSCDSSLPMGPRLDAVRRLEKYYQAGIPDLRALGMLLRARVELEAGDDASTADLLDQVDALVEDGVGPVREAHALELRGLLMQKAGKADDAKELLARSVAVWESVANECDLARTLRHLADLQPRDEAVETLKRARAIASGCGAVRTTNEVDAALRALGVRSRAGRPKGSTKRKDGLTAREEEVITLVASGATNNEIAERIFVSPRTVEDHIARAQKRLGVAGRAGLAAWAAKHGLI